MAAHQAPRPWDSPGKNTGVGCHFLLQGMKVKSESEVAQSCPTLRDPMDCSPPGFSVHGIFQAKVLEWGAIAFSESQSIDSELRWRKLWCSLEGTKLKTFQKRKAFLKTGWGRRLQGVWSVRRHSSDWLMVRQSEVCIINLLVPISLESRCLWQHTVNLYLVGISISAK